MSVSLRVLAVLLGVLLPGAVAALPAGAAPPQATERRAWLSQLADVREEIGRLQGELRRLGGQERDVETELARLRADLALRQAEVTEVRLRSERASADRAESRSRMETLQAEQERRRRYLAGRLRRLYLEGPDRDLRRLLGGAGLEDYGAGLRYAAYLNDRDADVLRRFRAETRTLRLEQERLAGILDELARLESELEGARARLADSERRRERRLAAIRSDRRRREIALGELSETAGRLADLIENVGDSGAPPPELDPRKFKGLMEWPAAGRLRTGFGTRIHPRFKTRVPHPGLDLAGDVGDDIRAIFDGTVVYASWMRGYGLTAIVDHGNELLSIYAHASVLLVEQGERVRGGAVLGKVGETGSLRGPFLYFELREAGKPIDPVPWLRRR